MGNVYTSCTIISGMDIVLLTDKIETLLAVNGNVYFISSPLLRKHNTP